MVDFERSMHFLNIQLNLIDLGAREIYQCNVAGVTNRFVAEEVQDASRASLVQYELAKDLDVDKPHVLGQSHRRLGGL